MVFNQKHGILICSVVSCGAVLGNWTNHLQHQHQTLKNIPKDDRAAIDQIIALNPRIYLPLGPVPIQGLPIYQGYECSDCHTISATLKGIEEHQRKAHKLNRTYSTEVKYQQLSRFERFKVFFTSILFCFLIILLKFFFLLSFFRWWPKTPKLRSLLSMISFNLLIIP